jgi:hypothetical protein
MDGLFLPDGKPASFSWQDATTGVVFVLGGGFGVFATRGAADRFDANPS